jgi:pimeloyl-ACP methyl ester carboxylesterase
VHPGRATSSFIVPAGSAVGSSGEQDHRLVRGDLGPFGGHRSLVSVGATFKRDAAVPMKQHIAMVSAISCALVLTVTACGAGQRPSGAGQQGSGALRVRSCRVDNLSARCGTLVVPEDRLTGRGRTIPISFVVLPAFGRHRSADPIVDFAGGPGDSAVSDDIPLVSYELTGLMAGRDVVFIDQRGTGGSNGLSCPPAPATLASRAKLRRSIESCLASLRGKAALQFYTSKMAAEDVAQVLTALHYRKVNLFGASYGATEAQVFQRLFPARVRTMTLLSGSFLGIPMVERFPGASQQALDQLFARCAGDRVCSADFPHLAADWAKLRAAPWVNHATMADVVHQVLMSADKTAYLPLAIRSLLATQGHRAALDALARQMANVGLIPGPGGQAGQPVIGYPIGCAEPWARATAAGITDPASYYYQNSVLSAQWWQYVCTLIPASRTASDYGPPRVSGTPVLMINGTADPQDPPANMAGTRKIWPNSREVAEPWQSHSINPNAWMQCGATLVRTFVETARVKELDTGCLGQVRLPSFAVSWGTG